MLKNECNSNESKLVSNQFLFKQNVLYKSQINEKPKNGGGGGYH